MTVVQRSLLEMLPPKRTFGLALLVAAVFVPLAGVVWADLHSAFIGELNLGHQKLDPRWAWPLIGLQGFLVVGIVGLAILLVLRRASRRTQNIAVLALLGTYLGLIALSVAHA